LAELPLVRLAFSRAELSFAKVRALTRIAESETEVELLELARHLAAAQLERAVRAYRRVTTEEAAAVQAAACLDWYWDEDGSLVLKGRLAPEEGAVFLQALEAAHNLLRVRRSDVEGGSAEPRPTNADAHAAVADAALSSVQGERAGGERYHVVVHVDAAALSDRGEGGCELAEGPAVEAETARRLACDAALVRLTERDGETLSVGRKTRAVPPSVRRALHARDRGCRFPGCENHRFVDAHHVRHWALGGETRLENLVLLCRRHHRLVHEGRYSVERLSRDELRFRDPSGRPIPGAPRPPPGGLDGLVDGNRPRTIDARTYDSGAGDRMDLDLAVAALLAIRQS
jgi:hypothetical protein